MKVLPYGKRDSDYGMTWHAFMTVFAPQWKILNCSGRDPLTWIPRQGNHSQTTKLVFLPHTRSNSPRTNVETLPQCSGFDDYIRISTHHSTLATRTKCPFLPHCLSHILRPSKLTDTGLCFRLWFTGSYTGQPFWSVHSCITAWKTTGCLESDMLHCMAGL